MPDAQDLVRLSLVSKRQDIINYIEVMCSENFKLTIASDFSAISFPNTKLLLIDASLFGDFDLANLEYGEKYSDFSICILPQNIPAEAINYVEKSFRYILAFPVSIDYFHTYIRKVFAELSRRHKGRLSQKLIQQKIPDSFSGYFWGNSNKIKSIRKSFIIKYLTESGIVNNSYRAITILDKYFDSIIITKIIITLQIATT